MMSVRHKKKRILIFPSIRKGNGSGHVRRAVRLAEGFINLGAEAAILFYSDSSKSDENYTEADVRSFVPKEIKRKLKFLNDTEPSEWDICIFDLRRTPVGILSEFSGKTMTLGLDEGGESRNNFDYLIDVLPNLEKNDPNISSPGFSLLPEQPEEHSRPAKFKKVLISFGGEDGNNLTGKILEMFDDTGIFADSSVTVIKGPFFRELELPDWVEVIDSPDNLGEILKDYDLVFTIFGLTCFEALYSRVPVILYNPSEYHRSLSIRAGIPEIGTERPNAVKLDSFLKHPGRLYRPVDTYSGIAKLDLAEYISKLAPQNGKCHGCGSLSRGVVLRGREASFFKCPDCKTVNMMYFGSRKVEYGEEYFFDDYKKQYGRTYLEDFEKIKNDGLRRCSLIKKIIKGNSLIDAGCGYGPFLSAAHDEGFDVCGIDLSKNAVSWVKSELGFDVENKAVENLLPGDFGREKFDAVTMWYVIEHLKDLPLVLSSINSMLPKGGVFAFSTPNFRGISCLRSLSSFLNKNPIDHYTIWSPSSARRLLAKYGFRVKIIKCPVIHPERFFSKSFYSRIPSPLKKVINPVIRALGRFFLIGDVFEVYAVKKKHCGGNH